MYVMNSLGSEDDYMYVLPNYCTDAESAIFRLKIPVNLIVNLIVNCIVNSISTL